MTELHFIDTDYSSWLLEQEPSSPVVQQQQQQPEPVVHVVDNTGTPPPPVATNNKKRKHNWTYKPTRLEFPVEREDPYPNPNYAAVWLMATTHDITTHRMRSEGACWLLVAIPDKADTDVESDTSHVTAVWLRRDMKTEQDMDCQARYYTPVKTELAISRNHLISVLPLWEWDSKIGRLWLSHKTALRCDHAFNQWSNALAALDPIRSLCQPW